MEDLNEHKGMTDDEMIQQTFEGLLNDYLASNHRKRVEIITKAFNFANQAHRGVKRLSGEPYIMHPLAVAKIVCNEIGLGSTSICAALLHDVVEDTDYTTEDIENLFGAKIAQIVDGLTKISGGIFGDHASAQAENFKKLLLTMSSDIRVILIKIADRLHNMRTLASQAPNKQYKIAGETLYLYAPLAYRLGLNKIKSELEDLSFKYEHPEEYNAIKKKLEATASERDKVFQEFTAPIRQALDKMGLKYRIMARVKTVYSIWSKMQLKHVPFEEVFDILAVRIIFEPKSKEEELNDCFDIYVSISKIYKAHPDRIRDWVSHPKSNGYQALHVTLMANNGQWIELQIRSERMNDIAEQGFAAHWKYKEGTIGEDEGELEKWLNTIKEILDDPQPDAIDFLDTIKLNLFAQEIFVFTPKGEIKTLPQNSTALDFAFSLHTEIGCHCIGAKVNHKLVPLSHKLQSGDQVEVLTSRSQRVQSEWLSIAATAKARNKIASILRKETKALQAQGVKILNDLLKSENMHADEALIGKLAQLHNKTPEVFLTEIGSKKLVLGENDLYELRGKQNSGWKKYLKIPFIKGDKGDKQDKNSKPQPDSQQEKEKINTKQIIKLDEEAIQSKYKMADCCHPIPGDDVLGYIDDNRNVIIHKRQCPVAMKLKSSYGRRILATQWDTHRKLSFIVTLHIEGVDCLGLVNDVTQIISRQFNVNIHKLSIETNEGIFHGDIQLYAYDVQDVQTIINGLKKIKNIKNIIRE
ncbi:MAG: bifunctional (p)ppGpp synthetase/guanosine-3',5'-bis(diphosphate) 3'-pyrophosphohydrolase [Bacteroidaceae bacterium]|nr:bifunctional (p)ppGpp synthetase/guanosine-3',5'-bis(diphosphate) 3'-pyrophosphohydrolase [Bacteroidaceae bacterium]